MRTVALRYALAPACVVLAALLHLSPAGPWLHPTGLFTIAVLAAAWFGGAGPGFLAAVLATFQLPQLIAMSYPLLGDFFDLPRFITFSIAGLVAGWWSYRSRRVDAALRETEKRYELVMHASNEGFWDWILDGDRFYVSPRLLEILGFSPDTTFAGRAAMFERLAMPPEDRAALHHALNEHFAGRAARIQKEFRILVDGEVRWIHARGLATRNDKGEVVRWNGAARDVTAQKRAEEALRISEERYARAMEASAAGHWDWNMLTDELFVSERAREMFELPPGPLPPTRTEFLSLMAKYRADMDEGVEASLRSGIFDRVYRVVSQTGPVRWLNSRGKVYKDAAGTPVRMTGSVSDITERKLALDELRNSEQRYALAMEAAGDGHTDWNLVSGDFYISPRLLEIVGHPPDARFADRADWVRRFPFHPEDRPKWEAAVAEHHAGRESHFKMELRIVVRGEVRWTAFHFLSTRDAAGKPIRWTGSIADITEQKLAEEALRESEERYERAMDSSEVGYFDWIPASDKIYASPRLLEIYGIAPGTTFAGRNDLLARIPFHPEDRAPLMRSYTDHIAGKTARYGIEVRFIRDGETRWVSLTGMAARDASGEMLRWSGTVRDVTERKRSELALRQSEERYELAMAASESGYWDWDIPTGRYFASPRAYELAGFPRGTTWASRDDYRARINMHPEDLARWEAAREALFAGTGDRLGMEVRYMVNGEPRWHVLNAICKRDDTGKVIRWTGSATDVTGRKLAEEELRESEARFRALTELSSDWYWEQDKDLRFTYLSSQADSLTGYTGESSLGKTRWEIENLEPLSCSWAEHQAVLAARQPFRDLECRRVGRDGTVRYLSMSGAPIFDDQGRFKGYQGIGRNITERRRAEEELRRLERQLRQAQRLEAMGTLAGGIAHDFNNILGAILGYGEMALREVPKAGRLARDLNSIIVAGERGRSLVDRVLAFSRSAVGERVPVHMEKVVREALDIVAAKLPPNITLHPKLRAGRSAILGDATQVHQMLMNLATNAVQAMPAGGTLRVSLDVSRLDAAKSEAPTIGVLAAASEYLVLRVADTGTGIAPGILEHIFDPFFTTKEVGTGTGLGLSLVHGIVIDLGGAIDVASTPGAGSIFTVYLPRSGDAADSEEGADLALPRGDGQRVLIVDDEEPLVRLATRTLEDLGYAPVGFTSSTAALAAFRADPQRFDAVITDERMPGISGSALIREVRGIRDRIPIVLMSGYVGGGVSSRALEAGAGEVLKKPLSARDLATSLARVLQL